MQEAPDVTLIINIDNAAPSFSPSLSTEGIELFILFSIICKYLIIFK